MSKFPHLLQQRFRGYLPVVVDVETAGFNAQTDALLEIAAVTLRMDEHGLLSPAKTYAQHILPFAGANLEPNALEFNGIKDPYHPLRMALPEKEALSEIFKPIRTTMKDNGCKRAILVGHNAFFDLGFLNAAVKRCKIKRNPFHPFSTFDTVTLAGMALGHTVLARSMKLADMAWDEQQAHGAVYDAEKTAELFCYVINQWQAFDTHKPWMQGNN